MRLFQNSGMFPDYHKQRRQDPSPASGFKSQVAAFLDSRYGASHLLAPVLRGEGTARIAAMRVSELFCIADSADVSDGETARFASPISHHFYG